MCCCRQAVMGESMHLLQVVAAAVSCAPKTTSKVCTDLTIVYTCQIE